MKKISSALLIITGAFLIMTLLTSCSKKEYEPFNQPFFYIHVDNKDSISVKYNRRDEVDYKVYLSSALQYEPVQVQFEIITGNGLLEGRDFSLKTTIKALSFAPGIFERSIRIAWLENPVDPAKNNTLIIRLTGNSKDFALGLPGPDKRQSQLVITKYN